MSNYRVWAPYASEVRLLLGNPDAPMVFDMHPIADAIDGYGTSSGWFEADVTRTPGNRYASSLRAHAGYDVSDGKSGDGFSLAVGDWTIPLPDPRSQSQPDGPYGFSEIVDLGAYKRKDSAWSGRILSGGLIYELHVGTFGDSGDFEGLVEHLDHLVELEIMHIELMPVQPFGSDRNWSYDGAFWHSVHEGYGGPRGPQQLIDTCHRKGLAVILDVVFNHFGPDGNYVGFLGPYTTGGMTGWGEAVNLTGDNPDEVRAYILDAVRQWLVDYHTDDPRLDTVHALRDEGALYILEQMQVVTNTVATETGIPRSLIAESDQNDPRLVCPCVAGGLGLNAQWDDDVHRALHTLVPGEDHAYYSDFGSVEALASVLKADFRHTGTMSTFRGHTHGCLLDLSVQPTHAFVTYTTTHNQTGNRTVGDRPSMDLTPVQQILEAAVIAHSPFIPVLFQGEEWGASIPFAFFCSHEDPELQRLTREGRLREFARAGWDLKDVSDSSGPETFHRSKFNWQEVLESSYATILAAYRDLFVLRKSHPSPRTPWSASVVTEYDEDSRCLVVVRSQNECEMGARNSGAFETAALVTDFSDAEISVSLDSEFGSAHLLHTFEDAATSIVNDRATGPEISSPV